jgi:Uncharacterized protein conserved in bacteria (DUF2213)
MAKAYCGDRISANIIRDNAGFIVATGQRIARSGWQKYLHSEIDPTSGDDSIVHVYRPPDEVLSPATLASFEGKPVCQGHPSRFVSGDNVSYTSKGHVQNVRRGLDTDEGDVTIVADIHIQDGTLAEEVLSRRLRDTSSAYTYDLDDGPKEGTLCQRNIRGNHVAIVKSGRAENTYIEDSRGNMSKAKDSKLKQVLDALDGFVKKYAGGKDDEPECNCGGKKRHSDACPCYDKEAVDGPIDKAAEGMATGNLSELSEAGEEMTSGAVEKAAGMVGSLMDDDETAEEMESEYERTGGPERKLKNFTPLIPTEGSGKGTFINPVSAKDARTVLENLRNPALRSVVKAQGRVAIDAYNRAVRAIRQQIAASSQYEHVLATDSQSRRRSEAADFESQAARFHGKPIKLHQPPNTADEDDTRLGEDSEPRAMRGEEAAADFETQVAQFHRKAIKR